MSVSLILVPFAIAAVSAWQASRPEIIKQTGDSTSATSAAVAGTSSRVIGVQTRMRDQALLGSAVADCGARVSSTAYALSAQWKDISAEFRRDAQGIWGVHFTGTVDEQRAAEIVVAIDQAYGRRVQQAVLERLRQRAPEAGMSIESETVQADDSVTLILNVGQGA